MKTAGPRLIHDADGLNTGVWPARCDHPVTPVDLFFTRSHAAVPRIDPRTWRLEVGGLVNRTTSFSLEELIRAFPRRHVTATLVCAGLRRNEFLRLGALPGELPWGPEPASTGGWTGLALGDLLQAVGVAERARYVEFLGLDQVERHGHEFGFGGSIDLTKALSAEVILATELNGAPLPPVHGFPLRAVVPGWIGARSVKWLGRITLLEEPSSNYFQSSAYRMQREINPLDPRDCLTRGRPERGPTQCRHPGAPTEPSSSGGPGAHSRVGHRLRGSAGHSGRGVHQSRGELATGANPECRSTLDLGILGSSAGSGSGPSHPGG